MEQTKTGASSRVINFVDIIRMLKKRKKLFFITLPIAFLLSCLLVFSMPRYYQCVVKLAPEINSPNMGNLGSLASIAGVNLSNAVSQDAIVPNMYPDMMSSADFQVSLFPVHVSDMRGDIQTTYYTYLKEHQRSAWWQKMIYSFIGLFASKKDESKAHETDNAVNPFRMTKTQSDIALLIGRKVRCNVDKKTNVISITVLDQDPLICATIADTARARLQQFIIDYRTKKARIDLEHAGKLAADAKKQYIVAQEKYAAFCDANEDLVLESFKSKRDELENEMQLKYNNYQLQTTQLEMAKAKLQERTPAFTILQNASVPAKPAGPKRMITVLIFLMLTFFITSVYIVTKETGKT